MSSTFGAVVTEHRLATEIGTAILSRGGNAVDAIIAAVIAVNTICPHDSDIGGSGFAIIRAADGSHHAIDFRDTAPIDISPQWLEDKSTKWGAAAIAVPGEIRGLAAIHQRSGSLPWADLFDPSINLAREGIPMYEDLYGYLVRETQPGRDGAIADSWINDEPAMLRTFTRDGKLIPVGSTWTRPEHASTLESLAKSPENLYAGPIAEDIVDEIQRRGGIMSLQDLRDYTPRWTQPISGSFRGHTVWTIPAPASGAALLATLATLDCLGKATPGGIDDLHHMSEALRFAFGLRTQIGDPEFVPGLTLELQQSWISREAAHSRARHVSAEHTMPPDFYKPPGVEIKNDHGTSSLSAIDVNGLAISVTTTVGRKFGSRVMTAKTGIMLNDAIDDFSIPGRAKRAISVGHAPSPPNYLLGGKRPLSSICPYVVETPEGVPILVGGAAGGNTIISANAQIIRNVLDYGMPAADAILQPRLHDQVLPDVLQLERASKTGQQEPVDGFTCQQGEALASRGHIIEWIPKNPSTPTAISRSEKGWSCGFEPRKHNTWGAVNGSQ